MIIRLPGEHQKYILTCTLCNGTLTEKIEPALSLVVDYVQGLRLDCTGKAGLSQAGLNSSIALMQSPESLVAQTRGNIALSHSLIVLRPLCRARRYDGRLPEVVQNA